MCGLSTELGYLSPGSSVSGTSRLSGSPPARPRLGMRRSTRSSPCCLVSERNDLPLEGELPKTPVRTRSAHQYEIVGAIGVQPGVQPLISREHG
jgi:hypothetical protein